MFVCCQCGETIGDDMYARPSHAPANLCFSCWATEWEQIKLRFGTTKYDKLMISMILRAEGHEWGEIADMLQTPARTLRYWRKELRDHPEKLGDWIAELQYRAEQKRRRREISRRQYAWRVSDGQD